MVRRAARHHQRHPLSHFGFVFGVFHVGKRMVLAQHIKAFFQKGHTFFAFDIAQMRHWANEGLARTEGPLLGQVGPKLLGHFELGIDVHRFFDVDRAISRLRRVVQFAQASVAGACVVPRVGTLCSTRIHLLNNFQRNTRVELFEQHGQGGTHDARSNQYYVDCFVMRH